MLPDRHNWCFAIFVVCSEQIVNIGIARTDRLQEVETTCLGRVFVNRSG